MGHTSEPRFWSAAPAPTVTKIGDLAAEAGLERIHVLAWRDLADVEAGGSELHAATLCRLWAASGIEVTMRTSHAQGAPAETRRDGYRVVRRAGRYLVFPRAITSSVFKRLGPRDAVVEIWNGVPFFTPLWAHRPRVTFLHHLHTGMWPLVMPRRLARAGQILERDVAPLAYRRTPVVTLSESSKAEIVERTALRPSRVHVVPPGVDERFAPGGRRSAEPLVVAVGRLMPSKRFDRLIRLVDRARTRVPATLKIVGEGYERDNLERLISDLGAESWCELLGSVTDERLTDLYRSAWIVASASMSEGWGMTVTEAAACGTPAVVTDIAGHRDAVRHEETGILAGDDDAFVTAVVALVEDDELRGRLGAAAHAHAQWFRWEHTAHDTLAVLAADAPTALRW